MACPNMVRQLPKPLENAILGSEIEKLPRGIVGAEAAKNHLICTICYEPLREQDLSFKLHCQVGPLFVHFGKTEKISLQAPLPLSMFGPMVSF